MLAGREAFDVVFNFAAAKHVRGERDIVSTLHMLETNVLLATRLLDCLDSHSPHAPYFAVSTDKAANPASIMGASKRIMETVMFAHPSKRRITSARFANVAFSNGSLLDGWVRRLAKRQPLAVPANVRRYFVSLKEAGEICLLAAALCRDRQVAFPVLDSQTELQDLESVLARVLGLMRLEGLFVDNATTAQELMLTEDLSSRYPVLVSRADTAGEKPFEEFLSGDEVANALDGAAKLQATTPSLATAELSRSFCDWLATVCRNPAAVVEPDDLLGRISAIVPGFAHHASDASLDARM
jgi:FlaA1/EpsC-like NDP-sugar epimerase